MPAAREYGVAATIEGVMLRQRASADYLAAPPLAAGDVTVSKDGGTFANIVTLPIVTPSATRSIRVTLNATEMAARQLTVLFVDQTAPKAWEDLSLIIETYGHASAQFNITPAMLLAATANKLADHILRRQYVNARLSADGDALHFRSLLGAVGKLVNRVFLSGNTLTITQENDSTATAPGGTQTVTKTPGADPITAVDTN